MIFYGIKDQETGEFVSYGEGKPVLANDRHLLMFAIGQLHGLRPSYRVEEYTEKGGGLRNKPQKKGLYLTEVHHRHPGSIVLARNNSKSFFVLAYWDGDYFIIDNTRYHHGNVLSWMFLETGFLFQ